MTATPSADLPAFLSVPEAAKLLGVSRNSLYAAIERGEVPGVRRIGKLIRVRRAAIMNDEAWPGADSAA